MAELVAQARWPKNPKALALEPHREELLRLRRTGESVAAICAGLRGLGIEISDEALRLWLNRESGHKPTRRRKPRFTPSILAPVASAPAFATLPIATPTPAFSEASAPTAVSSTLLSPANTPVPQGTSLIRPGETPLEAFSRRQREREAAADAGGVAKPRGRIARDDF